MILLKPGASKVRIDELGFSPDGTAIVAPAGHQGVMIWRKFASNAKSEIIKPPLVCKRFAFSPDGTVLYAGNDQLCAFHFANGTAPLIDVPKWAALGFGVSPDGSRLVVAENPKDTQTTRLTIWATDALEAPIHSVTYPGIVYSALLFPPAGGHVIVVEGELQPWQVWEYRLVTRLLKTGAIVGRSEPLPDCPDQSVLSADGQSLACRTRETIRIYPASGSWKDLPTITNDSQKHFTGIAFHPSGKFLAATSNDTTVKLFDTATWKLTTTFTWDIGRMRSIAFSPDGNLAAAGSDTGKVVVWDVDL